MAMKNHPWGKDKVVKSSESYIERALAGGSGPSEDIQHTPIDRPNQSINTAFALDNVDLCMPIKTSIKDMGGIGGGVDNLKHSLTGSSAVNEEVGATGKLKHHIIPDH